MSLVLNYGSSITQPSGSWFMVLPGCLRQGEGTSVLKVLPVLRGAGQEQGDGGWQGPSLTLSAPSAPDRPIDLLCRLRGSWGALGKTCSEWLWTWLSNFPRWGGLSPVVASLLFPIWFSCAGLEGFALVFTSSFIFSAFIACFHCLKAQFPRELLVREIARGYFLTSGSQIFICLLCFHSNASGRSHQSQTLLPEGAESHCC